jgi:hypothetical protein
MIMIVMAEYSQAELENNTDQVNPNNDESWQSRG